MNEITRRDLVGGALALSTVGLAGTAAAAAGFELAVVAFQMSSETHARVANAAAAAGKAKGWSTTILNSEGSLPKHAEQLETLIQSKPSAIIVAMGKPVEAEEQLKKAKDAGIPVVMVMSGASPHILFDIEANEYKVGAEAALWLLGQMGFQGKILTERFDGNVGTRIRGRVLDAVLAENTGVKVVGSHAMARTQSWRDDVRQGMQTQLLQHGTEIDGLWASFDGQAFVIDDILKAQGVKKGQIKFVSIDGGAETFRRIADPDSLLMATVAIPFEAMGSGAVEALDRIVVKKEAKAAITAGPYLFMDATLVDAVNVAQFLKP
ncbi:sugar ABC transporter substrate-binding protein [Siculibacillus lacustris]|uniref:Sugar ABC transporter substrate-binding protein n=1 Tax=Siculibacillus lacustris TaxID=1549641 RepID=A0A4Q9VTS6_9HYPH|nr:sugar ABC transporter substrate-binding protein [Siculibacillus lacustris]TBW39514.1 sugar ABC transporter substrate-binding protein [Siculibacillus lacustris]